MKIFTFFIFIFIYSPVHAAISDISNIPITQCQFQKVFELLNKDATMQYLEAEEKSLFVTEKLSSILTSQKFKFNNQPVIKQLTPEKVSIYTNLIYQDNSLIFSFYLQSRHMRDLKVIKKLVMTADLLYQLKIFPNKNDPDYIYYTILLLPRNNSHSITKPTENICSLDYSLYKIQQETLNTINYQSFIAGVNRVKEIAIKNNMKVVDLKLLNKNDRDEVIAIKNNIINPVLDEDVFNNDIDNIRLLSKISTLIYNSYVQDYVASGGDINAMGKTLQNKLKNNELSVKEKIAVGVWIGIIDDKIPDNLTEFAIKQNQINKMSKTLNKTN